IFQPIDSAAPEIVRVEMDTPWIVHIYFNESLDPATGGDENNYDVGPGFGNTIDKVCFYGDNVTLNLTAIPGSGVGSQFNLVINGVKDSSVTTTMSNVTENNINIPNVDFQGSAGQADDWFEIQASKTNPSPGETILITVYHKNICGYLTGANQVNANTTVGTETIVYGNSPGSSIINGPPGSVDVTSGKGEFNVTIAAGAVSGAGLGAAYFGYGKINDPVRIAMIGTGDRCRSQVVKRSTAQPAPR
ncbi:MAG: hypothetical protein IH895_08990, partial [Planctomycetes bacterium]|nr:hypothetical protein [Planctomycetota bacterium]